MLLHPEARGASVSFENSPRQQPRDAGQAENEASSGSDQDALSNSSGEEEEDREEEAANGFQSGGVARKGRRQRIHFDVEQLQALYHLPLKTGLGIYASCVQAAEQLGICEAALKRICRRNRIHKWPYRQLSSVRRRIADLKGRRALLRADASEMRWHEQEENRSNPFLLPHEMSQGLRERSEDPGNSDAGSNSMDRVLFAAKLKLLNEEQTRIIRSAHEKRPRTRSSGSQSNPSGHYELPSLQHLTSVETQVAHPHGPGEDIMRLPTSKPDFIDQDFPLLFLANVCESIRAHCNHHQGMPQRWKLPTRETERYQSAFNTPTRTAAPPLPTSRSIPHHARAHPSSSSLQVHLKN